MGHHRNTIARIRACSPAKLNLFLHVTGRRADGYHTLQTAFQLLDWGDEMLFEPRDEPGIELSGELALIPPEDNLILRAAARLDPEGTRGARIHIDKIIPMGGGLGGGSSNAATSLLALNALWNLGVSAPQLIALSRSLGADVPVFTAGHSAWAEGIGEDLKPLAIPPAWYVIIWPRSSVSTAEIFNHPELTRNSAPITVQAFFSGPNRNDLEAVVMAEYPEVRRARDWLSNRAPNARMTGSGGCVFASIETQQQALEIAAGTPPEFDAFVAEGLDARPEMCIEYES